MNQRRCRLPPHQPSKDAAPALPRSRTRRPKQSVAKGRTVKPSRGMLQHVRMVVSLIEGRSISRRQVQLMLAKILRQHTLTRRKQIDQTVRWLHKQPP